MVEVIEGRGVDERLARVPDAGMDAEVSQDV